MIATTAENLPNWEQWLADHIFTPSELESYLLCPFRFYAQSFLKLKDELKNEIEMTPPEVGYVMHEVLEKLLQQGKNSEKDALLQKAFFFLDQELESFQKKRTHLSPVLIEFQKEKMQRTLKSFVEDFFEERNQQRSLKPKYFEWSFYPFIIEGSDGRPIRIGGRIDRIDVDDVEKRFLVIDYKTGSKKTTGNQILAGESLQLPLYIMAIKQLLLPDYEPIGGLYYQLSDMSKKDGLLHSDRLPPFLEIHPRSSSLIPAEQWESALSDTKNQVRKIVSEIYKGEFLSMHEPCETYCAYQDICRIRSQTRVSEIL